MFLLRKFRCRPTALFVSLLTLVTVLYIYYVSIGETPGKSLLRPPRKLRYLNTTGTGSQAENAQKQRIATLKEYCRKTYPNEILLLDHLMVIEKTKTIYCFIPKTGCTATKLVFYNLQHDLNESNMDHKGDWIHVQNHQWLSSYTSEAAQLRLETYTKFIVVRDPLERLASAWFDKFVDGPSSTGYRRNFHRRQKTWWESVLSTLKSALLGTTKDDFLPVPFRDFLRSIETYQDDHWAPFYRICGPCQVEYDFIAHTDTLADDLRLFFHKIGVEGKDGILPRQHPRRAEANFSDTFRQVPKEVLQRIGEIFKPDFEMFGYSFNEDLELIEQEGGRG